MTFVSSKRVDSIRGINMWARKVFSLPRVFLDIKVIDGEVGRLVIELRKDVVPKTAENFLKLCAGRCKSVEGKLLTYKKSKIHRILPGFMISGGDFTKGDGTGGASIYGYKFEDENFTLKHSGAGVVSMVNSGPNSNSSLFMITLAKTSWLDGKNVVFGQVVEGMEFLTEIGEDGTMAGTPREEVVIEDCGEVDASSSDEEETATQYI
jgi:cyclophilin family peptidyl-prolyl cis-trans isomerase